jgi:PPOX class probable FMN-dependent enzyme
MVDLDASIVTNVESLTSLYAPPADRIVKSELDYVNATGRAFIAASPFLVLATGSQRGIDCSPKGDRPGFVEVSEDGRTLFIPDPRGNNKIESLKNLLEDPRVGLIFFVPSANETYRVNGHARVSADADLRRRFTVNGKEPTTVIVVEVKQAFPHCPKALVRSNSWQTGSRGRPRDVPTLGAFAAARFPETDSATFDAAYAQRIMSSTWNGCARRTSSRARMVRLASTASE